ncbi:hypothetical protein RND81_06G089300 [Saponaria officinalis]|uniref:Transcription factor TCP2-like n=1 Tax=Saponaria officinalis TaxID=3572 RepID=A0AAW1K969_SAPOF
MEVDDFHSTQEPASKYSRLDSNGKRLESSKIGLIGNGSGVGGAGLEDKADVIHRAGPTTMTGGGGGGGDVLASTRFGRQWQHSSRIIRVSRASGGKDRHSKVWTAKGPRDRRVRLSVNTAIQFYDLQDRLGYDQPSKAVEWLIKAAAESINELPSLSNINFPPETPRQLADEPRSGNNDAEMDADNNSGFVQDHGQEGQEHQLVQVGSMSMSKSGCSSNNSETSKGSGLSLSRTEIRVKARERARERTAKEKETGGNNETLSRVTVAAHHQHSNNNNNNNNNNVTSMGQTSSFTQLLTAGINNLKDNTGPNSTPSPHSERGRNIDASSTLQWLSSSCTTTNTPMADYFGSGFMGLSTSRPNHSIQHLGNNPLPHVMALLPFNGSHEIQQHQQQQQQQLPFFLDQHHHHPLIQIPNNTTTTNSVAGGGGNDYNLNFSISSSSTTSGLAAGFNRGTLQSNSSSPSFLSYLHRLSATDGGSSVPFFLGGAPIVENQHHHHHYHHDNHQQFNPAGLHLNYGDAARHPDDKGKGKN